MHWLWEIGPEVASEDIPVVLPERRAGHDRPHALSRSIRRGVLLCGRRNIDPLGFMQLGFPFLLFFSHDVFGGGAQKCEPGLAIRIGERLTVRHLVDVGLRVQLVTLDVRKL